MNKEWLNEWIKGIHIMYVNPIGLLGKLFNFENFKAWYLSSMESILWAIASVNFNSSWTMFFLWDVASFNRCYHLVYVKCVFCLEGFVHDIMLCYHCWFSNRFHFAIEFQMVLSQCLMSLYCIYPIFD